MKKVELIGKNGKGKFSTVDDIDFEWINQWKWYISKRGYAVRDEYLGKIDGKYKSKTIYMHVLIHKTPEGFLTDHINRNKLDNTRDNLRTATFGQNTFNSSTRIDNKSGYKGVSFFKNYKKWRAVIQIERSWKFLGYFETKEEASIAYNKGAKKYFGEFAVLNTI